jgi:hypothetical protein
MPPRLCIVSVYRPDVFEEAVNALSLSQNIEVIVDRRIGDRPAPGRDESASERRRYGIEEELRTVGYAFVD